MKKLIMVIFGIFALDVALLVKVLTDPAAQKPVDLRPVPATYIQQISAFDPNEAVSTFFTVLSPDGSPCHVKLVQTSGANSNLMNLVTDCPQRNGKADWGNSTMPQGNK